jgi:hypothetical protein
MTNLNLHFILVINFTKPVNFIVLQYFIKLYFIESIGQNPIIKLVNFIVLPFILHQYIIFEYLLNLNFITVNFFFTFKTIYQHPFSLKMVLKTIFLHHPKQLDIKHCSLNFFLNLFFTLHQEQFFNH